MFYYIWFSESQISVSLYFPGADDGHDEKSCKGTAVEIQSCI